MNLEELKALDGQTFKELVEQDVRGSGDPATRRALHDPSLNVRSSYALIAMKKSVESQLGAKRSDLDAFRDTREYRKRKSEYEQWRAGAIRFKGRIEARLLEIREQHEDGALLRETKLKQAIKRHQTTVLSEFEDASEADVELWETLGIRVERR